MDRNSFFIGILALLLAFVLLGPNALNEMSMYSSTIEVEEVVAEFVEKFEIGEEVEQPVSVLAVGDIMLGRFVRTLIDENGSALYPFERILEQDALFFQGSDIVFGNLEGPIFEDGYKSSTSMIFGFPEYVTPALKEVGFDVMSIANNHILNQGFVGYLATITTLGEHGIGACGNPLEENTENIVYEEHSESLVGFVCFEDVHHTMNYEDALEVVAEVSEEADYVVLSVHWGYEYKHTPNARVQVERAHGFVEAGADLIIGHHPHVVQPFEIYEGAPIFYSLGNFVFDQYWGYDVEEGLVVRVVFDGEDDEGGEIHLFPIHSERSQPYLMNEEELDRFYDRFLGWGDFDEKMEEMIRAGVVEF
ncbi:CapA family protein [Candidatus Peregrinibacteria bacterium]|jgi:poly-gamma-glutamate capsule biosynthesis protein CapA/YwtB (metallophosphatase superfamily)|nr:CapA family protein [Candidatus Peregrinibacteria bacterium]MBT4056071.1 CapA family protein [Candidatus Peregrinibacteria bacterium]